jgi:hypothetical protein
MSPVCDAGDAIRLMKALVKYFLIQAAPLSVNKRQKVARKNMLDTRVRIAFVMGMGRDSGR